MRPVIAWVCLVLMTSCAMPTVRHDPRHSEALIIAFVDDFHSGVLIERQAVPTSLLPANGQAVPAAPWVVLHFGERRWIRGEADGVIAALRLALLSGDGGVQIDLVSTWRHDRGGTDPTRVRLWVFPATQAEVAGVVARLHNWISTDSQTESLTVDTCWRRSTRAWTLMTNCHDFTADLLSGAGIHLDQPPFLMADGMRASLDRAWAEREAVP